MEINQWATQPQQFQTLELIQGGLSFILSQAFCLKVLSSEMDPAKIMVIQ